MYFVATSCADGGFELMIASVRVLDSISDLPIEKTSLEARWVSVGVAASLVVGR